MQMVSVKLHSFKSTTNLWQTWEVYQDFPKTRCIGSHWRQSQTLLDFLSNPKKKEYNCDRQHTFMKIRLVAVNVMYSESVYCSWFQTFAVFWMLYAFFWVIPRRLDFIRRHFRTLCPIFIGSYAWSMTGFEKTWSTYTGKGVAWK